MQPYYSSRAFQQYQGSCTINLNITKPPWCIPMCSGLLQQECRNGHHGSGDLKCDKTSYTPSFPKLRDLSWMMWGYCCWSINFIKTEKLLLLRKKRRIAAGAQKTKNKNKKNKSQDGRGRWLWILGDKAAMSAAQRSAGIVSADVGDSGEEWVPRRRRAAAVPGACWVQSTDPSRNLGAAWQRRRPTTQDSKLHCAAAAPTPCSFTRF